MKITVQSVYELVRDGMEKQGGPSFAETKWSAFTCKYMGDNNRRCAAGMLIPLDYKGKVDEALNIRGLMTQLESEGVIEIEQDESSEIHSILCGLQGVHDGTADRFSEDDEFMVVWKSKLEGFRKLWNYNHQGYKV